MDDDHRAICALFIVLARCDDLCLQSCISRHPHGLFSFLTRNMHGSSKMKTEKCSVNYPEPRPE